MVNISYIQCSGDVVDNYTQTIEPRFYNYTLEFKELINKVNNPTLQLSPFRYTDNTKTKQSWTNEYQNTLWLDFDDGFTIEQAKEVFKDYQYIIYTTKSHQQEKKGLTCDRFRVILRSSNIPKGELYWDFCEELSKILPIDKQVNNPTGSFLGSRNPIIFYNDGKEYDCSYLTELAKYRQANKKKAKLIQQMKKQEQFREKVHIVNVQDIKNYMDMEDIFDLLEDLGYETNRYINKFKYREERTPSCKVYPSGYMKDYGSDFQGDIIDVVQEKLGLNFIEAVKYIENYMKGK